MKETKKESWLNNVKKELLLSVNEQLFKDKHISKEIHSKAQEYILQM